MPTSFPTSLSRRSSTPNASSISAAASGALALKLADHGRTVIGVDPAVASLDVARAKTGADRITWLEGDAAALSPDLNADLVVMTGNAAQAVLTDAAWSAMLRHVHAALKPAGAFVFETRRPEQRGWQGWAHSPPVTVDVPGVGPVERSLELTDLRLPLVAFRFTYRFLVEGSTLVSDSTIRFRGHDEIETSLREHGFRVQDVRETPDRPGRELVFVAGHA